MKIEFENMAPEHASKAMEIFNYFVLNSFSAYPDKPLPETFWSKFIEMTQGYPAYIILSDGNIAGFCFLRSYNPFPSFKNTAEITYFIHPDYTGKGIGQIALEKLLQEAKNLEIKNILASISSKNEGSIRFHQKNGFKECRRFPEIGNKFQQSFDVVWMIKTI